jgi:hypothetical protein
MSEDLETKVKTDASEAKAEVTRLESYVKAHTAWAIGVACFLLGAIAGHYLHL